MRPFEHKVLSPAGSARSRAMSMGFLCVLTAACVALVMGLAVRSTAAAPPSDKANKSAPAAKTGERDRPASAAADDGRPPDDELAGDLPENPFPRRFKAPELEGGTGWLNTRGEITMKDLRGKVVLLDFWTF